MQIAELYRITHKGWDCKDSCAKINQSFLVFVVLRSWSCNYVTFSVKLVILSFQRTKSISPFRLLYAKVVILFGYRVTLYCYMNINFINLFFSCFSNSIIFYKTMYFANSKVDWSIDRSIFNKIIFTTWIPCNP